MGFIYKIEVDEECYVGSTIEKYLSNRQGKHNYSLNNSNNKSHNKYLYKYCREHNVKKIICKKLEEVDNENIRIKEQEYINKLKPTLNSNRAFQTEEEREEQKKKCNKIYYEKKSNCPICNKLLLKNYIKRHILRKHNI